MIKSKITKNTKNKPAGKDEQKKKSKGVRFQMTQILKLSDREYKINRNRRRHISTKTLSKDVHGSFIYNGQNLDIALMFIHRKMNKQIVIYSFSEILLINKKEMN